jgi:hypothetical protein
VKNLLLALGYLLIVVNVFVACSRAEPPPANLATRFVLAVESDAKCTDYYTDLGEQHTHSAVCRTPAKAVIYCTVAVDKGPACQPLTGDAAPAPSSASSASRSGPEPAAPPKGAQP